MVKDERLGAIQVLLVGFEMVVSLLLEQRYEEIT